MSWSGSLLTARTYVAGTPVVVTAPVRDDHADPLIGMVVADRYRILRRLGRGGMGVVYEVEHTAIGKRLAMKLLAGELTHKADVVKRFKREALAASRLQNPNTVQVFDYGSADGLTYLVMELVHGETLSALLRREGPMRGPRLAKIVIQICNALAEAHERGVVHRDIKPDNVMLLTGADGADVVKVVDFGLAKLRESDALNDVTSSGTILGTPYYMAPEQIRGDGIDGRADVYSIGALMYVALTGHHPFSGRAADVLLAHLTAVAEPPSRRFPHMGIDGSLSEIVARTLRKDPNDRPASASELRRLLAEVLRGAGSSSVEALLDPACVQALAIHVEASNANVSREAPKATRDDVDAYERRLRTTRRGWLLALGLSAIVGAGAALVTAGTEWRSSSFDGREAEPNDQAAAATPIPFGTPVTGYLGRRIDSITGDRDYYVVDIPGMDASSSVHLEVTALPNIATCAVLWREGLDQPLGRFCGGAAARPVIASGLELSEGRYWVVVMQDVAAHDGSGAFVHENISDPYRLTVSVSP